MHRARAFFSLRRRDTRLVYFERKALVVTMTHPSAGRIMALTCCALLVLLPLLAPVHAHSEYLPGLLRRNAAVRGVPRKLDVSRIPPGGEGSFLTNVRRITQGGTNAEAYWSFDDTKFTFQAIIGDVGRDHPCDLIYNMNADGSDKKLVSPVAGRDSCSYFMPDGKSYIYSSSRDGPSGSFCPPPPDMNYGYIWPLDREFNIYHTDFASGATNKLTNDMYYNAESTIAPDGSRIVYTSTKTGDLELWSMRLDGTDQRRLTNAPGYDGGAYYSYDSKKITWRANRPRGSNLTDYLNLLQLDVVNPVDLQIMWMDTVDLIPIQVTNNPGVSFSPFFLPNDQGIIFSSNMHDPMGGNFQLYWVSLDGKTQQQITTAGTFNSFPMFSFSGKQLAWASDRNATHYGDMDIFVADWTPPVVPEA